MFSPLYHALIPSPNFMLGMGESDDCKKYIAAAEHHYLYGERHRLVDLC